MYRYRPYQSPGRSARATARRSLAMQTAVIGGVVGFSVMIAAIAVTVPAGQ